MRKLAALLSLAAIAVVGVAAYSLAFAGVEGGSCPGKVACPLTGDEVCKDQCPLVDEQRADCPGKVECPLTGDLVCSDACPLDPMSAASEPSCCLVTDSPGTSNRPAR